MPGPSQRPSWHLCLSHSSVFISFCYFVYFSRSLCIYLSYVPLCFSHISLPYVPDLFLVRMSLCLCLLCVVLSLLSDPPYAVAKPLLGTGGFLPSSFV